MTETKRLPDTTYAAEYPYNAVHISRSGHEFHVDDTPGKERIRQAHKSGTYFEVSEDGTKVELVVKDGYTYYKGGLTLTIDGNGDIKIGGNLRVVIEGDAFVECKGDMTSVVYGDSTSSVVGNSIQMVGGDALTKVEGSMSAKVDGNLNTKVEGDLETEVGGDSTIVAKGEMNLEGSEINIKGNTKIKGDFEVTGDTKLKKTSINGINQVGD